MNAINTTETCASQQTAAWPQLETVPDEIKEFLNVFYPQGLVCLHNTFLAYVNGYWKRLDDVEDVQSAIAKYFAAAASLPKINAMFGLLRLACVVRDADFKAVPNLICFLNGVLNLETYQLLPHNPHFHLRSGRNVNWDQNAVSPAFEQYLQDVFRDDDDKAVKVQFIKEWMGLCLIPETKYEKFVVCVGAGGNGKSVLLKLMPELLGHENIYSAPIQRLSNRHSLAELEGKLVLSCSEINENTILDDGVLKQLVSGDPLEAERKYGDPFVFTPYARVMLATNHLPKLRDVTHAFFRRLVLIKFNRMFTAEEMDMNLSATLRAELAGIFVMAVDGLRSLRERGHLPVPESSIDAAVEYREISDVNGMFVADAICRTTVEEGYMRPHDLYGTYVKWCKAYKFSPDNRITFGKYLSRIGIEKYRTNGKDHWLVMPTEAGNEVFTAAKPRTQKSDKPCQQQVDNVVLMPVNVEQPEELKAA